MKNTLRHSLSTKLVPKQIPRIACKLLALNQQELLTELRTLVDQNPILEINETTSTTNFYPPNIASNLNEHLINQLAKTPLAKEVREDVLTCLGLLDQRGYLPSLASIIKKTNLDRMRSKQAVTVIRQLHPVGVGAHNLADSMLLQLNDLAPTEITKQAKKLIKHHFSDLKNRRLDKLPKHNLTKTLQLIETLNPDLSSNFTDTANYITADLEAYKNKGVWKVRETEKRFMAFINKAYKNIPRHESNAKWRRLIQEANAIIAAIEFRQNTLLTVAQVLVAKQRDFFEYDKKHLKPIRLVDIAAETNLGVSTISTTIANKSISTPSGVITLKYLLQRKTAGDNLSAIALQEAIKDLVRQEDTKNPLSDISIMKKLELGNQRPSRRTVAKHRKLAGILPAYLRKERVY